MAGLFPPATGFCRLLDAGAGIGSLSAAFLDRWLAGNFAFQNVEIDAFEVDETLGPILQQTFARFQGNGFLARIHNVDFIQAAVDSISRLEFAPKLPAYTHVILNPPYKKITSKSAHRLALRRIGIETVNLYSAFVALAVALCAPGGQIVAIIPRSFCNGPYYRSFRDFILERTALHRMHLFIARNKTFKNDGVLQENIIVHLERNGQQGPVTISTSTDDQFTDLVCHEHPFENIVSPADSQRFIHVPLSREKTAFDLDGMDCLLSDLGLSVSTGPIVDFRMKTYLCQEPSADTVPLLYPAHFENSTLRWPMKNAKKPNAIIRNQETEKWLYPQGHYCVVRRLSSKEEKRRIIASIVDPSLLGAASALGFENHLNVFHQNKAGLPRDLAYGLAAFLNTTVFDECFRRFNGNTQVNATDLRVMKYPSRDVLMQLGKWVLAEGPFDQKIIDAEFRRILARKILP